MAGLLYREDMDDVRARLKTWWEGGDIGRPAMALTAPRAEPLEHIPIMPQPPGWVTDYSTSNYAYRVNLSARQCINTHYLAEAVPAISPDLAPNCLALYLGCKGVDMPGTVWCEPVGDAVEDLTFKYDPANFYWQFSLKLGQEQNQLGQGKFLLQFPDLIEGLDTLAAMRGTDRLLVDLIERPEWVQQCLRAITDRYFHYYDILYDLMRDEVGGSIFWLWAPGRMAKFQCDFSAMISPAMFKTHMLPVLTEMTERVSYSIYHWDGPGAIPHHDHLLSIPRLKMIQWTPGAGVQTTGNPRWYPLYHKTIEAGKKVFLVLETVEDLELLAREFGRKLKQFYLILSVPSLAEAQRVLELVSE
jgi:5-methyltetrahydrofolate--homocysteine methyltransferase